MRRAWRAYLPPPLVGVKIARVIKIHTPRSALMFLQRNRNLQCIRCTETIKKNLLTRADVRVSLLRVPQCHGNASPDASDKKYVHHSRWSYFCRRRRGEQKKKNSSRFRVIKFLCSVFINSSFLRIDITGREGHNTPRKCSINLQRLLLLEESLTARMYRDR